MKRFLKAKINIVIILLATSVVGNFVLTVSAPKVAEAARTCRSPDFEVIVRDITDSSNVVEMGRFRAGHRSTLHQDHLFYDPPPQPDSNPYPAQYEINIPQGHIVEYIRRNLVNDNFYDGHEGQYQDIEYRDYYSNYHFLAGRRHVLGSPEGHQQDPFGPPAITESLEGTRFIAPPFAGASYFRAERQEGIGESWCSVDRQQHISDQYYTEIIITSGEGVPPVSPCSPAQITIAAGSSASYNLTTQALPGFDRPVIWRGEITPNTGTPPVIASFQNNNQVPPATTVANITTTANTTPGEYHLLFTGLADNGSYGFECEVSLTVTGNNPDFNLVIQPYRTPENPVLANLGNDAVFQVFAECLNGFEGPIFGLTARTAFTNLPDPTLGATQLDCNPSTPISQSTTLTVTNTNLVIPSEQSTWPNVIRPKDVFVAGSANL